MTETMCIEHTYTEGTTITGTAKGDGSAAALKAQGWRWSRNLGCWYVRSSRFHLPDTFKIAATVAALEADGFSVGQDISTEVPDMAEVEAAKDAQLSARAEALDAKATRRAGPERLGPPRARRRPPALGR